MKNILHILKRDILRLLKVPPAIVVVLALLVLPSVYTWYNVIGFWNPYNNTGNLQVDVVDEDAGAYSDLTGSINIGEMIVDELGKNDQLDWGFTDYDDAMSRLKSGEVYAVFVIPKDFSEKLLTITTGDFTKPNIDYYVNEKAGPVAPKITDSGATTLDETINSAFVRTVSEKAVQAIDDALEESREQNEERTSNASAHLGVAIERIDEVETSMTELKDGVDAMGSKIENVRGALTSANASIDEAAASLGTLSSLSSSLRSDLSRLSAQSMPAINQGISLISQTSAKAAQTAAELAQAASIAQGDISSAIGDAHAIVDGNERMIANLRQIADSVPDGTNGKAELLQAIQLLEDANERAEGTLQTLEQANDKAASVTASALEDMNAINEAVQKATDDATNYTNVLFGEVIPALEDSLSALSEATSTASAAVNAQKPLIQQAIDLTYDMDDARKVASDAVQQTIDLLEDLKQELATVQADVISIGSADAIAQLLENGLEADGGSSGASGAGEAGTDGEASTSSSASADTDPSITLNASRIADFMGSPTDLVTEQLYTLNAYGAAMAPLFMNLTFWIGAFMLIVIMRQEVDGKGIKKLTLTQRYLGRFLLFAIMVVLQASICCTGLPIIGVEIQSLPALFFAAIVSSLAYLSIIYALSVTLQHIGKGICIVLVFAQIPGATGLYPIEMTAPFFQAIYPILPFTYGINAMRESICGFYGMHYLHDILVLLLFFALAMAFGILVRPLLSNVNRLVARQVKQSGIYNGEDVHVPLRRYRLSQVVRALADKDEYRRSLEARYERFTRLYPKLIKWSAVVSVVVPVIFTIAFSLNTEEKIVLLNAWMLWLIAVFLAFIIIESLRASIDRQLSLDRMSDSELRQMYRERHGEKFGDELHEGGGFDDGPGEGDARDGLGDAFDRHREDRHHDRDGLGGKHATHKEHSTHKESDDE